MPSSDGRRHGIRGVHWELPRVHAGGESLRRHHRAFAVLAQRGRFGIRPEQPREFLSRERWALADISEQLDLSTSRKRGLKALLTPAG